MKNIVYEDLYEEGKGPLIYDNKGFPEIPLHYDNTFTAHA